jgi:hypothetical protein
MWTARDQLQGYQFLRRRLVSALVTGDANNPVPPSRRLMLAYALGFAIMLLAVAGIGVYSLVKSG